MSSNLLICSVETITAPIAEKIIIPPCTSPNITINQYKLTYQYISGEAEAHIKNVYVTFSDGTGGGPHMLVPEVGYTNYYDNPNTWLPFSGIEQTLGIGLLNIISGTSTRGTVSFSIADEQPAGGSIGTVAEVKFYINDIFISSRYFIVSNGWKEYSIPFLIP